MNKWLRPNFNIKFFLNRSTFELIYGELITFCVGIECERCCVCVWLLAGACEWGFGPYVGWWDMEAPFVSLFWMCCVGWTLGKGMKGGRGRGSSSPAVINASIHRLGQFFLALWTLSFSSLSLFHALTHLTFLARTHSLPLHLGLFQFGDLPIWIWTKPHI